MTTKLLEVISLSLTTKSHHTICRNLSFTIAPTQIWGILGSNGSGKSTILKAIRGILSTNIHHELKAQFKDQDLTTLPSQQMAKYIGYLFQELPKPDFFSVWDYCLGGRFPHRQNADEKHHCWVKEALVQMELLHKKEILLKYLSGGEKKRASIAMVLAQNPELFLLDEPNNHLDLKNCAQVFKHFRHLASSHHKAFLIALHDINLAQAFCDKIILLGSDKILIGDTQDVLTETNLSSVYQYPVKCWQPNNMWSPLY